MKALRSTAVVPLIILLASCGGGEPLPASIQVKSFVGSLSENNNATRFPTCPSDYCQKSLRYLDEKGNPAYAYLEIGVIENGVSTFDGRTADAVVFNARVNGDSEVNLGDQLTIGGYDSPAMSGSASWSGPYTVSYLENPLERDFSKVKNAAGLMVLDVDFDSLSISGQSTDGRLLIAGDITGISSLQNDISHNFITGISSFDGASGNLAGNIGSDAAIGVVSGADPQLGFAGGFVTQ